MQTVAKLIVYELSELSDRKQQDQLYKCIDI
jgi:hypothetical protein